MLGAATMSKPTICVVLFHTFSINERDHPPSALHAAGPELMGIPGPRTISSHAKINSNEDKTAKHGTVEEIAWRRCSDCQREINQTLCQVMRTDHTVEDRMLGHFVCL